MTAYFNDITAQHNQKKVLLYSENGKYYCESKEHKIREVDFMTYVCDSCRKTYMGPLMVK